jgi:hypothetical protein
MQAWVYDIETFKKCFTYVAINTKTQEVITCVIHKNRDDSKKLYDHLTSEICQIGFNNLGFDYPVLHYFLRNYKKLLTTNELITELYDKAQGIINYKKSFSVQYNPHLIKEWEMLTPQLDLYKIWHYDNPAKLTSLKALQISTNYPNVVESRIPFDQDELDDAEVEDIIKYNLNDVLSTYEFYKKSADKIQLRKDINKKYGLQCRNYPDVKIGEELLLKLYCELTDQDEHHIKKLRSVNKSIDLKECVFNYIKFESPTFNDLLNKIKNTVIINTKEDFKESVIYKGFKYDYGTGGIHGCIKEGVYCSDDYYDIIDADVTSLYPNIAVQNNLYPKHLGKGFVDAYKDILDQRTKAKRAKEMSISDGLKLSANGAYGKSASEHSFLFDTKFTMSITVNGQLLLTMLAERLVDNIPDITVLQINTDGITVKLPKIYLNLYDQICNNWEADTKLNLEYVSYSKMIIRDVNNYMAVSTDNKLKYKGRFEIDKDYHKDPSFRIIPLALSEYFVKGISIETTIKNHRNIYDFCGRQKFKSDSYGYITWVAYDQCNNPYQQFQNQQKNTRYYISTGGTTFIKCYKKDNSTEFINKGYTVTIFNEFEEKEWDEYGINYSFYIKECQKEINLIESQQLTLF